MSVELEPTSRRRNGWRFIGGLFVGGLGGGIFLVLIHLGDFRDFGSPTPKGALERHQKAPGGHDLTQRCRGVCDAVRL